MVRWALVAFVIAILTSVGGIAGGSNGGLVVDVAIAAFLFGAVTLTIAWVSREQTTVDEEVGKPWSP